MNAKLGMLMLFENISARCGLAGTKETQEDTLFDAGKHDTLGWLRPTESSGNPVITNRYDEVKSFSTLFILTQKNCTGLSAKLKQKKKTAG
jgi:hypothetical protein